MQIIPLLTQLIASLSDDTGAVTTDLISPGYVISAKPVKFYYGSKGFQNIEADKKLGTLVEAAAFLDWPLYSDDALLINGAIEQSWPVKLFFFKPSRLDDKPDALQTNAIDPMRALAYKFVQAVVKSKLFKTNPPPHALRFKCYDDVHVFDRDTSGTVLNISLTPLQLVKC